MGNQLSIFEIMQVIDTILQIEDYRLNRMQSSNDDIMSELQKQNKLYLKQVIANQEKILNKLDKFAYNG